MRWRAARTAAVLAVLIGAAAVGLIRSSSSAGRDDPVREVAAGLRCPACQGESVADSRSPVAAAMRQVVAEQLAQGRDGEEIRRWFVQRYGGEVLADPPYRGPALLLWAIPALALLATGYAAVRTLRPSPARPAPARSTPAEPVAAHPAAAHPAAAHPATGDAGRRGRFARRAWRIASLGLVAIVASVAVAATRVGQPADGAAPDPAAVALLLARDLEQQNRHAAAADVYREALRSRPDEGVRLRLAFALIRAGQAAEAEQVVWQVLATAPDSPEGLLVLGLAQRQTHPADATATLRRFLTVAPDHPAAAEITRLLASRS
jgi:cytochrome c-type biogenesis protein CcmH/NrfF